jgi:hypothetical protein
MQAPAYCSVNVKWALLLKSKMWRGSVAGSTPSRRVYVQFGLGMAYSLMLEGEPTSHELGACQSLHRRSSPSCSVHVDWLGGRCAGKRQLRRGHAREHAVGEASPPPSRIFGLTRLDRNSST